MSIRKGDIVTLTIETVAFGGEGLGRVENLVVFVPFTAGGDVAEVEIREAKKRFLRGRVRTLIAPSAAGMACTRLPPHVAAAWIGAAPTEAAASTNAWTCACR